MLNIYGQGGFFRGIRFNPLQWFGLAFLGFGLLFMAIGGVLFMGSGFFQVQKYVQGQCTITEKHMENETSIEKDSNGNQRTTFLYRPSFTYQVHAADGRTYSGYRYEYSEVSSSSRGQQQAILDRFQVNSTYPCWYNPGNPSEAVLQREVGAGNWILVGVFGGLGLLFAIIGAVVAFKARRWNTSQGSDEQNFSFKSGSSQSGSVSPSFEGIFNNVNDDASSGGELNAYEMMGAASQMGGDQLLMHGTGIYSPEREDMMSEINQLVERYIPMWNESDARIRRETIAELFAEDGVQFTTEHEHRGYEGLEERVSSAYKEFVEQGGFVFRRAGDVQAHHNAVKLSWEMVPAGGGEVAATGTVFLLLNNDGRIQLDYHF